MFAFLYRARGVAVDELEDATRAHLGAEPARWVAETRDVAMLWSGGCKRRTTRAREGSAFATALVTGRIESRTWCRDGNGASLMAERLLRRGADAVAEFVGDFAALLWDGRSPRVILATDHLANEPLYYTQTAEGFNVATALPLLLSLPGTPRIVNGESMARLLAGQMGASRETTAWAGVYKVTGGHRLELTHGGGLRRSRWWKPEDLPERRCRDPRDFTEELRTVFTGAVRDCLPADGPVAATLSGGLDSTLVAGYAAELLQPQGRWLHAWTSVPQEGLETCVANGWDANDWPYASRMAELHCNIVNRAVTPGNDCILDTLQEIVETSATPVRNSANHLWLLKIARLVRQQGADRLLTGNRGNGSVSFFGNGGLTRLVRQGAWIRAAQHLARLPQGRVGTAARLCAQLLLGDRLGGHLMDWRRNRDNRCAPVLEALLKPPVAALHSRRLEDNMAVAEERSRRIAFATQSVPAFGADFRLHSGLRICDPTGDRRVMELVLSLPPDAFIGGGHMRLQARLLGAGVVPDEIRWRTTRGEQAPEAAAYCRLHAARFTESWAAIRNQPALAEWVDLPEADLALRNLIQGEGSLAQATTLFRIFHVGMFLRIWKSSDVTAWAA